MPKTKKTLFRKKLAKGCYVRKSVFRKPKVKPESYSCRFFDNVILPCGHVFLVDDEFGFEGLEFCDIDKSMCHYLVK